MNTIFSSATPAKTFPASTFKDADENPALASSFDVQDLYVTNNTTHFEGMQC